MELDQFCVKYDQRCSCDNSKKKFFATFPYPYVNGLLHLGHAMTATKVDFISRYHKSKGYNVLFPFAYHGTGAPIFACSKKISEELEKYADIISAPKNTQIAILLSMSVPIEEIPNFKDPKYWILYFSKEAEKDVRKIGLMCDLTRSFYTTDLNPHYDSFVKWHFTKLARDGYLVKGKRYVIYSEKDKQVCADHDRSVGESVEPKQYPVKILNINDKNYVLSNDILDFDTIVLNEKEKYIEFSYNGKNYVASENFYNNFSHQNDTTYISDYDQSVMQLVFLEMFSKVVSVDNKTVSGIYSLNGKEIEIKDSELIYYQPEKTVISRSGDKCVVALSDQWFIDYDKTEIKDVVKEHIEKMELYNPSIKKLFNDSVDWIKQWPVSRNFGLGTCLPDTDILIDSLSDSTIYPAYYTIAHIISKIPIELLTEKFWDAIFLEGVATSLGEEYNSYLDLIVEMATEFDYWYPLDLRVSGKDLIQNHLTMCLFNHMMVWKNKDLLPKSYMLNGYLMLNKEKMSKSTGNFMTLRDACDKYGADCVRFALADNEGIDDGNFDETIAISIKTKLENEKKFISDMILNETCSREKLDMFDEIFMTELETVAYKVDKHYQKGEFRQIRHLFYGIQTSKQNYIKNKNDYDGIINESTLTKYIKLILTILEPICPFWVKEMRDMTGFTDYSWVESKPKSNKYLNYFSSLQSILSKLESDHNNMKKKTGKDVKIKNVVITLARKFNKQQLEILEKVKLYFSSDFDWKDYVKTISIDGCNIGDCRKFATFVKESMQTNGIDYYDYFSSADYIDILNKYVKKTISKINRNDEYNFEIKFVEPTFVTFPSSSKINIMIE